MVFSNKNRGHFVPPPPIITKVHLPLIITKVKVNNVIFFNGGSMKVTWKLRGPGRREPVGRPGRLHGRGCGAPPTSH